MKCVQKDRDLWRVYVGSKESRSQLLTEGIDLRNTNVKVYDTNPYSAGISSRDENVLKITIIGVPLSVDDKEVTKMLQEFNVSFTSDLKYEKIRHPVTRRMTSILNGNRFIYIKALNEGVFLPRTSVCAGLRCSIYHYGQPSTRRTPRCMNCWEESHYTKECPNKKRCKVCKSEGHEPGNCECEYYTEATSDVIPFAGSDNCLSNFFPCDLKLFGVNHRSAEHAFQYVKAMRSGDLPRASAIQVAKSALDAKKIGKQVVPSPSFSTNQTQIMTEIIKAKAEQVPVFAEYLKKHENNRVFVETTYDNFWASGLDKEATMHTCTDAWPGANKLGLIISEIASCLRQSTSSSQSPQSHSLQSPQPQSPQPQSPQSPQPQSPQPQSPQPQSSQPLSPQSDQSTPVKKTRSQQATLTQSNPKERTKPQQTTRAQTTPKERTKSHQTTLPQMAIRERTRSQQATLTQMKSGAPGTKSSPKNNTHDTKSRTGKG